LELTLLYIIQSSKRTGESYGIHGYIENLRPVDFVATSSSNALSTGDTPLAIDQSRLESWPLSCTDGEKKNLKVHAGVDRWMSSALGLESVKARALAVLIRQPTPQFDPSRIYP